MIDRQYVSMRKREAEENLQYAYEQEMIAIRIVGRWLSEEEGIAPRQVPRPATIQREKVGELPPLDEQSANTLVSRVMQVFHDLPEETWPVRRMLRHLQNLEFPLRANKPEFAISSALSRLAKQGRIAVLRQGTGKVPSLYRGRLEKREAEPSLALRRIEQDMETPEEERFNVH